MPLVDTSRREATKIIDDAVLDACYICDDVGGPHEYHHISYFPEETVVLCESCHEELHSRGQYSHISYEEREFLQPDTERPPGYGDYETMTVLANADEPTQQYRCDNCDRRILVNEHPITGPEQIDKQCNACGMYNAFDAVR